MSDVIEAGERQSISDDAVSVGGELGFEDYRALYHPVADAEREGGAFAASVRAHRVADLILFDRTLRGVRHERARRRVSRDGFDHCTVQIALEGGFVVSTDAGERRVRAGEATLIDMARPMATRVPDSVRMITLSTPRWAVEAAADPAELHGAVLPLSRATLLGDFLASFLRTASDHDAAALERISRVVTELLALALSGQPADMRGVSSLSADALCRQRARRFIDANLAAGPDDVASAVGRSRSALYRAFEPSGGVARFIRSRRLQRLRMLLSEPDQSIRINELCYQSGFASNSEAARAFRAAFAMTPGEFRAMGGMWTKNVEENRTATSFARWWNEMR